MIHISEFDTRDCYACKKRFMPGEDVYQIVRCRTHVRSRPENPVEESTISGWYEIASKMPEGKDRNAFVNSFIPEGINALGLGDKIHPVTTEMFQGNPNLARYMANEIRAGRMNYSDLMHPDRIAKVADAASQFGSREMFVETVEAYPKTLEESAKFAASEEGKGYRASLMQGGVGKRSDKNLLAGVKDDFDQNVKPLKESYGQFDKLGSLIETRSAIADQQVRYEFARIANGAGVLSNQDVTRVGADTAWTARINQFITNAASGQLSEENRKQYKEILPILKRVLANKINSEAERALSAGEALELDPAKVKKVIAVDQILKSKAQEKTIQLGGRSFTLAQLKQFKKDHPKDPAITNVDNAIAQLEGKP